MPGVLAAIGLGLDAISSVFSLGASWKNYLTQSQITELEKLMQEQNSVEGLQANFVNSYGTLSDAIYQKNSLGLEVKNSRLALMQAGANISAYDQTLARFDSQYASGLRELQVAGRNQFYQLMQNYAGVGVSNAARGQRGGSSSLIAQMAKNQVIELAGSDMKLDAEGGTYGYSLTDYFLDQLASQKELQANRDITAESWDIYHDTLMKNMENYDQASKLQDTAKNNMRDAFEKLYNYYGSDIQNSLDSYNKELEAYNKAMDAWLGGDHSYSTANTLYNSYTNMNRNYDAYAELLQKQKDAISPFNEDLISQFLSDDEKGSFSFDFTNALESQWNGLKSGYGNISSEISSILSDDDDTWSDDDVFTPAQAETTIKVPDTNKAPYKDITAWGESRKTTVKSPSSIGKSFIKKNNKYEKGWRGR